MISTNSHYHFVRSTNTRCHCLASIYYVLLLWENSNPILFLFLLVQRFIRKYFLPAMYFIRCLPFSLALNIPCVCYTLQIHFPLHIYQIFHLYMFILCFHFLYSLTLSHCWDVLFMVIPTFSNKTRSLLCQVASLSLKHLCSIHCSSWCYISHCGTALVNLVRKTFSSTLIICLVCKRHRSLFICASVFQWPTYIYLLPEIDKS